jgi:hypothetical protein
LACCLLAATVMSSSARWPFLVEAVVLIVHVFPNADKRASLWFVAVDSLCKLLVVPAVGDDPSAYLFLSMFMLVKVYLFARLFKHYSDLQSANGKFIGYAVPCWWCTWRSPDVLL